MEQASTLKVFVSNLPAEWDDQRVKEFFEPHGSIQEVSLFKHQGQSKNYIDLGCAYVTFNSKAAAEKAIELLTKPPVFDKQGTLVMRWADGEAERIGNDQLAPPYKPPPTAEIWVEYFSSDGRAYYWDARSGQTQWDKPRDVQILPGNQYMGSYGSSNKQFVKPNQGPPGCNLFIFHLPNEWSESELISHFSPFGNVVSARIMTEKETKRSRGFGFVSYDNPQSAFTAMKQMNGYQASGKRLKVQIKKGENPPGLYSPA